VYLSPLALICIAAVVIYLINASHASGQAAGQAAHAHDYDAEIAECEDMLDEIAYCAANSRRDQKPAGQTTATPPPSWNNARH
jgi:hypothetical protein